MVFARPFRSHTRDANDPAPRVLYFDIDGTLVHQTFGAAKCDLANGRFERAVRRAKFDRIVCVSDAVLFARLLSEQSDGDVHDHLLPYCAGTIQDASWFREHVELVADPAQRAAHIDRTADWYFLDDFAYDYLERDLGSGAAERARRGGRALDCDPTASGREVLQWLRAVARRQLGRRPSGPRDQSPSALAFS